MKKLKIIAVKNRFFGFGPEMRKEIATIYVKDGKVAVESKLSSILKLRDKIQKIGETGGFLLSHTVEETGFRHRIGDPEFLDTLLYAPFWEEEFNGWSVLFRASKVVDEQRKSVPMQSGRFCVVFGHILCYLG